MLVFEEYGDTPFAISPQDLENSDRLHQAIVNSSAVAIGWSKRSWAKEVQSLNSEVGDTERVQKIIDWYCLNIGKPYVPIALCAKTFRKKFPQLELAYNRLNKPSIIITPEAEELSKQISRWSWGNGKRCDLTLSVQNSLNNREKILDVSKKSTEMQVIWERFARVITEIISSLSGFLCPSRNAFVKNWYESKHKQVKNWKEWSGKFSMLTFTPQAKELEAVIRKAAQRYAHNQTAADLLLERLQTL